MASHRGKPWMKPSDVRASEGRIANTNVQAKTIQLLREW
jgi:hypothetical protein